MYFAPCNTLSCFSCVTNTFQLTLCSDHYASIDLGEQVAISILRDMKATFNEPFTGFTFTDFKGNNVFV